MKANNPPCVRNCCLNEEDICLGCFRSLSEILSWHDLSEEEKITALAVCKERQAAYYLKYPGAKPPDMEEN